MSFPSPSGRGVRGEGGFRENQLAVFERLGLFNQFDWASEAREKIKVKEAKDAAAKEQRQPVKSSLLPFAPSTRGV